MKKVFQSRVEKSHGTCMQAVVASLFEIFIDDVPNFIECGENWYYEYRKFFKDRGYKICSFRPREPEIMKVIMEHDGGVNGYWDATVASIFFGAGSTHAVVIDKNLNVVHDPNPNNFGHVYKREDILSIEMVKSDWYMDVDGKFVVEDK